MKNKRNYNVHLLWIVPTLFILLVLQQAGVFKDPVLKEAEKIFYQKNDISIDISEIDTVTNEKFANILIRDFGNLIFTDSLLKKPKEVHHYRLKAKRKGSNKKHKQNNYNPYEFSSIFGGLTVDKEFNRIENPLNYRVQKQLDEDYKCEYDFYLKSSLNNSPNSN